MKVIECPWCHVPNNSHDGPTRDSTPQSGDISLCWECRKFSVMTAFGVWRKATEDEMDAILRNPQVKHALALVEEVENPLQVRPLRWKK